MNAPSRRVVIGLPVILTLLIAVVIGALIVVENQRQADQVAEAEKVAQDYLSEIGMFRASVVDDIKGADGANPGKLRRVVDKAIAHPPRLAGAPTYGRQHSAVYAEAAQTRAAVLAPYRRLSTTLARADTALDFIRAARKVLGLRASDYVGFGFITSSTPVRSKLIPAFVKARDEFDHVTVPKGQEELAAKVHDAVQYVIDQATVLADRIESRRAFSFTYDQQFREATEAVSDYGTQVNGDVIEAVNAVTED